MHTAREFNLRSYNYRILVSKKIYTLRDMSIFSFHIIFFLKENFIRKSTKNYTTYKIYTCMYIPPPAIYRWSRIKTGYLHI